MVLACHAEREHSVWQVAMQRSPAQQEVTAPLLPVSRHPVPGVTSIQSLGNLQSLIATLALLDSIALKDHLHRILALLELFPLWIGLMMYLSAVRAPKGFTAYVELPIQSPVLEELSVHLSLEARHQTAETAPRVHFAILVQNSRHFVHMVRCRP